MTPEMSESVALPVGSGAHQIAVFLRHPHLRSGRAAAPPDELSGEQRIAFDTGAQTLADWLGADGGLVSGQPTYITLGVLSATHYLLQNGWRHHELSLDRLLVHPDGRILLDTLSGVSAVSMRLAGADLVEPIRQLVAVLCEQIASSGTEVERERLELESLLERLAAGAPFHHAFAQSRCIEMARRLDAQPPLRADRVDERAGSRRRAGRFRNTRQRSRTSPRAVRPASVDQWVRVSRGIERIRGALGSLDSRLEVISSHFEMRARRAVHGDRPRSVRERLLTPRTMATTVVVAIVIAVLLI